MEKRKFFRQGDIAFEKLDYVPLEYEKKKGKTLIITGEREGHAHRMKGLEQVLVPREQQGVVPAVIVVGEEGAEMTHPDHPTLSLTAGVYRITQFHEHQNVRPVD